MYGVLCVRKPYGPTSRDCVNQIQRIVKPLRVGHAGTLDPLADGVLLVLVGPSVRLMDEIHELDKEYEGEFQLGAESDSLDTETAINPVPIPSEVNLQAIQLAADQFVGLIKQRPPAYSAIRIDGKRAHELARKGREVEVPEREVAIHSIHVLGYEQTRLKLRVRCGTGTYIRTLADDIAKSLNTRAIMTSLTRTRVGPFELHEAIDLQSLTTHDQVCNALIAPQRAIPHLAHYVFDDRLVQRLLCGQRLYDQDLDPAGSTKDLQRVAMLDQQGRLRGILGRQADECWRCNKGFVELN